MGDATDNCPSCAEECEPDGPCYNCGWRAGIEAIEANVAVLRSAQDVIAEYLPGLIDKNEALDRLIAILDGPEQRAALEKAEREIKRGD